jgi:hypothetical protein
MTWWSLGYKNQSQKNQDRRNMKELKFIRKKRNRMGQGLLEMKLRLDYDAYEQDSSFEEFSNDEKDLILGVAMDKFRLK